MRYTKPPSGVAAEAIHVAAALREAAPANRLAQAIAEHIDAIGHYWHAWMPETPTDIDRTSLALVRAAAATLPKTLQETTTVGRGSTPIAPASR